jgi:hypothetical protein
MKIKYVITFACMLTLLAPGYAQNTYIPYELGGASYYTMYGSPDISASVSGTNEFERGDIVTLLLDLNNYGRILGFKEDQIPQNPTEYALANAELQEEYKKPTALGVIATLVSNDTQIEVKSGDQVVQALRSGEKTQMPLKFTIKIGEHASGGEHPLNLNLTYDYQDNVRVDASGLSSSGSTPSLTNFRTSYIYKKANQTVPLFISIKKQADFEIADAKGSLPVGAKKAPIEVTYRNIGDQAVKDAVARLSIFKPFSSIDDQAYIGSLDPQEAKTVTFRLDVDSDATPKDYGINSEIKYSDINGDTVISESMKIPVAVTAAGRNLLMPVLMVLIILAAAGVYMYKRKQKKGNE